MKLALTIVIEEAAELRRADVELHSQLFVGLGGIYCSRIVFSTDRVDETGLGVLEMGLDERYFAEEKAVRKGRSKSPCVLKVGITLDAKNRKVVLRALDKSGTASLVALMGSEEAARIAEGLRRAAEELEKF